MNTEISEKKNLNLPININKINKKYKTIDNKKYGLIFISCIQLIIIVFCIIIFKIVIKHNSDIKFIESKLHNSIYNSNKFNFENGEFNEAGKQKYISHQQYFCQNQLIFNNSSIEEKIEIANVNLTFINFNMFVYKKDDIISNCVRGKIHLSGTSNVINILSYYSKVKI